MSANIEVTVRVAADSIWNTSDASRMAAGVAIEITDFLHARLLLQCRVPLDLEDFWGDDIEPRWRVRSVAA